MSVSPFDLPHDLVETLRAVRDGRGLLEPDRDHATFMMAFYQSSQDIGTWVGIGRNEEEAREDLDDKLAALAAYEELANECGDIPAHYRDFIERVRAKADESGIDRSGLDEVGLVREWERYSELSAANWLIPDSDDIERIVATASCTP